MSAPFDWSSFPDNTGTMVLDVDTFGVVSATDELDAAKLEIVPVIRRILQNIRTFLDTAVRSTERLKTINVAFDTYEFVIGLAKHRVLVVKRPLVAVPDGQPANAERA